MEKEPIRQVRMARQLRDKGIRDPAVLQAMRRIPRQEFVEEALHGTAYRDAPLPIGDRQSISQPRIVAKMCELLEPDGSGRVLEIGTGSGYHAAVLSLLFEQVYTVERNLALSQRARATVRKLGIENVHFKVFDGSYGWSEFAPYRGIVVTAAAPDIPEPLIEQLQEEGKLVVPLGGDPDVPGERDQELIRVLKQPGGKPVRERHGSCRFVPLVGRFGWKP